MPVSVRLDKETEELLDKVRHYLGREDERRELARAAHERVMREHTFAVRMEQMVGIVRGFLAGCRSGKCEGGEACQATCP